MSPHPEKAPIEVVAAAIVDDLAEPSALLAARRTEPPELAGGWEFPGGKVDPGEDLATALHREIREELGVTIAVADRIDGPLDDGRWPLGTAYAMSVFVATVTDGVPAPIEDHDELRWLRLDDLYAVRWLPADLPIIDAFAARFRA
ncbi:(deoxy)nucleoside triphosphate pyrophosphohydrolase [Knoellia subterranea]|uniref:8-oxo-dGTP diphosphatase n=1 Tax=Knoellia subterranea KCTC 19937 TaxID=1385521 RepID=A0A0A0JRY7_9MICO|nr:(deoxy)nucleoside triphosphate pyrophosphohydrolase [Knoellia subterranea]KGN39449.1 DNA mismatch repair protein MutT [Knoellia subterranea KCTC 19937]